MSEGGKSAAFEPFQQSGVYAQAVAACGARVRWIGCGDRSVLAIERGRVRLILRVADLDRGAMRRLSRWPGLTIVTPEEDVSGFGLIPLVTGLHHAIWALGPDIRAGLARNWLGHLRQAERAGIEVQRGTAGTLTALIDAEAAQRSGRGYKALPGRFSRRLPEDALRLWEWRQDDALQAAMCFVVHQGTATYHLAWGTVQARQSGVHKVMLIKAAEALWREGVHWLDLGSVDTERAPGLARFKLGTGASLKRLGATTLVLP